MWALFCGKLSIPFQHLGFSFSPGERKMQTKQRKRNIFNNTGQENSEGSYLCRGRGSTPVGPLGAPLAKNLHNKVDVLVIPPDPLDKKLLPPPGSRPCAHP